MRALIVAVVLLAGCAASREAAVPLEANGIDGHGPVKRLDLYVLPYYQSPRVVGEKPKVDLGAGTGTDQALASERREDIVAVRDAILVQPALVSPVTMMVLAVRLYDMGMRDDAAFWFYAAKLRYATLAAVIDTSESEFSQVEDAMASFAELAGPSINAYAFCNEARWHRLRGDAIGWVEENPYGALELSQFKAMPGDRKANLARALKAIRDNDAREVRSLLDPSKIESMRREREQGRADERYCWPDPVAGPGPAPDGDVAAFRDKGWGVAVDYVSRLVAGNAEKALDLTSPVTIAKEGRDTVRKGLAGRIIPQFRGHRAWWNPGVRLVSDHGFAGVEVSGVILGAKPFPFYVYVYEEDGRFVVGMLSRVSGL